jgi:two-component system, OmpR family, response regulator ChvI
MLVWYSVSKNEDIKFIQIRYFLSAPLLFTGLGLYISKNIVEAQNGRIRAKNNENNIDGNRGLPTVIQPITEQGGAKLDKQINEDYGRKKQVLVVDDELDITLTLKSVLENSGFNVDLFNDPLLALQNFKTNFYDLIILDVKMPQMNGFDLYEKIEMIDNKVKVCFLTAWSDFRDYKLGRKGAFSKEGEIQLIQKPIENEKLIEQINTII